MMIFNYKLKGVKLHTWQKSDFWKCFFVPAVIKIFLKYNSLMTLLKIAHADGF